MFTETLVSLFFKTLVIISEFLFWALAEMLFLISSSLLLVSISAPNKLG